MRAQRKQCQGEARATAAGGIGRTVTEVAREIGVSAEGLRNWVKQDTIDCGQGAPGELTSTEREEVRRVVRSDGSAGGYAGGPAVKHTLLALETAA
ncbi:transposase [Streptomyces sp. NPDC058442]|uniref:transposase n=1 Tax=Streptomyces sp. NPDC058442 TaxID=3346503 RepID=UPI00364F907C